MYTVGFPSRNEIMLLPPPPPDSITSTTLKLAPNAIHGIKDIMRSSSILISYFQRTIAIVPAQIKIPIRYGTEEIPKSEGRISNIPVIISDTPKPLRL